MQKVVNTATRWLFEGFGCSLYLPTTCVLCHCFHNIPLPHEPIVILGASQPSPFQGTWYLKALRLCSSFLVTLLFPHLSGQRTSSRGSQTPGEVPSALSGSCPALHSLLLEFDGGNYMPSPHHLCDKSGCLSPHWYSMLNVQLPSE